MKVFDLCCASGHVFEGWFASEDDFSSQREGGLLDCPLCGVGEVSRLPSAPRLNLGAARNRATPESPDPAAGPPQPADAPSGAMMAVHGNSAARFVQAVAELMRNTEDVGTRFAEEARRIHYGEVERRAIRGQTTPQERVALADEGIEVYTLPVPLPSKSSLQ